MKTASEERGQVVPHALANGQGRFVPGLPEEDAVKAQKQVKRRKQKPPLPLKQLPKNSSPPSHSKVAPQPELPPPTIPRANLNPLHPAISVAKSSPAKRASKKQSHVVPKSLPEKRTFPKPPPSQKEPNTVKNLLPSRQVEFCQPPDMDHGTSCLPPPRATNAVPATHWYKYVDQVCLPSHVAL